MPLKARRALLGTDGTIYCPPGTVLPDDDPVAAKHGNAVVGTSEPVTEGYETTPPPLAATPPPAPEPVPEPEPEITEQSDDEFLENLAADEEDEEPEEDEGVDL